LAGEVTYTPAKATGAQMAIRHTISNKDFGMQNFSNVVLFSFEPQNCNFEAVLAPERTRKS
jgi:hypothetical protein